MGGFFGGIAATFEAGGIGMYPIAVTLIFSLAIIADRIWVLYFKAAVDRDAFMRGLKKHIYAGDLDKAVSYVAGQKRTPLTAVIKSGLIAVPKGEEDVQAALDEATLREAPVIERRTGYLAMLGNVATLLGLLGTIYGLIKAFGAVSAANPADKATILSASISEAMNCTAFGLAVAIPSLIAYSVLQGRTQAMMDELNESAVGLLNLIMANRDKMRLAVAAPVEDVEEEEAEAEG